MKLWSQFCSAAVTPLKSSIWAALRPRLLDSHLPESLERKCFQAGRRRQADEWKGSSLFRTVVNVKGMSGLSFVRGRELVVLLRLKWGQQSKQAVIFVQLQEVSGCECVWESSGTGFTAEVSTSPHTGRAHRNGTTARYPADKQLSTISKCRLHTIHS